MSRVRCSSSRQPSSLEWSACSRLLGPDLPAIASSFGDLHVTDQLGDLAEAVPSCRMNRQGDSSTSSSSAGTASAAGSSRRCSAERAGLARSPGLDCRTAVRLGLAGDVPGTKSDPLCPHIVDCEYEAPAFTIRVVDKQTGQPLAGIHGIASWIAYGGPRRRWPLMVLEAVSGPDGQLSFPAWGPVRSDAEGVLPGYDPVISLFLSEYRAGLIHNASTLGQPDTARVRPFNPAGRAFQLDPFQGSTADTMAELRNAGNPFGGATLSEYDPEPFQRTYVTRLRRIRAEAERLPYDRDVGQLFWRLDSSIRLFTRGGKQ